MCTIPMGKESNRNNIPAGVDDCFELLYIRDQPEVGDWLGVDEASFMP